LSTPTIALNPNYIKANLHNCGYNRERPREIGYIMNSWQKPKAIPSVSIVVKL